LWFGSSFPIYAAELDESTQFDENVVIKPVLLTVNSMARAYRTAILVSRDLKQRKSLMRASIYLENHPCNCLPLLEFFR
jgi:hypothetical protein